MSAAAIGGIISGVAQLLGSIYTANKSHENVRDAAFYEYRYGKWAAQYENGLQRALMTDNASLQKEGLQKAGLSLAGIQNGTGVGSVDAPSVHAPNVEPAQVPDFGQVAQAAVNGFAAFSTQRLQEAQAKNTDVDTDFKLQSFASRLQEQAEKTKNWALLNTGKNLENNLLEKYSPSKLAAENRIADAKARQEEVSANVTEATQQEQIDKVKADLNLRLQEVETEISKKDLTDQQRFTLKSERDLLLKKIANYDANSAAARARDYGSAAAGNATAGYYNEKTKQEEINTRIKAATEEDAKQIVQSQAFKAVMDNMPKDRRSMAQHVFACLERGEPVSEDLLKATEKDLIDLLETEKTMTHNAKNKQYIDQINGCIDVVGKAINIYGQVATGGLLPYNSGNSTGASYNPYGSPSVSVPY